ncbi:MAG: PAS domain S-box protein [Gammaproteobacteria bacterium]|nr:PAS domain S-box protein [Gammaproteobacteria bacterium]
MSEADRAGPARQAMGLYEGRVRLLYESLPTGLLVAALNIVILCLVEWGAVPYQRLALWALGACGVVAFRYALSRGYRRDPAPDAARWGRRYAMAALLAGASWGVAAFWLFPPTLVPQIFIFLILTAVTTASVVGFVTVFPAACLFVFPAVLPLAARLFFMGDALHQAMAVVALLFMAVTLLAAHRMSQVIDTGLDLRRAHGDFIRRLEEERAAIGRLNGDLRREAEERAHAAQRAVERERYLRAIVDNVQEGIVTLDRDGTLRSVNREAARIFGYAENELVGQPFSLLVPAAEEGEYAMLIRRGHPGEERGGVMIGFGLEVSGVRRDGTLFPMEIGLCRVACGEGVHMIGITRDISERKRHERLRHDLLSTLNHELKTPLAATSAALSLMAEGLAPQADPEGRNLLRIARNNLTRLTRVVEDILDIDHRQIAHWPVHAERLDLMGIAAETLAAECDYAASHGIHLTLDPSSRPAPVSGDRHLLIRALSNLVANAVHLSPPHSVVELAVSIEEGTATVSVRDCGIPIPQSVRPHLFSALCAREEGLPPAPISLSVARVIAEKHGGTIGYAERPGGGSHFFLRFALTFDK